MLVQFFVEFSVTKDSRGNPQVAVTRAISYEPSPESRKGPVVKFLMDVPEQWTKVPEVRITNIQGADIELEVDEAVQDLKKTAKDLS